MSRLKQSAAPHRAPPKEQEPSPVTLPARVGEGVKGLLAGSETYTDHGIRAVCAALFSGYAEMAEENEVTAPRPLADMMRKLSLDISLQREGVGAMVRLSGYSVSQLARLMRRYYAATPHGYLKALRLATAKRLVTETSISLESISYECGYHCYGYFTVAFKERYGVTPAALRKNNL